MDNYSSKTLEVSCGVPQATVLGLILFIIFINDLLKIIRKSNIEVLSFADDTSILISEKTFENLYYEADKILNKIDVWFRQNELKLNIRKSKYICFAPKTINYLNNNYLNSLYY